MSAQKYEVGAWGGVAHYYGDLNNNYSYLALGIASGVLFKFNWDPNYLSFRTGLSYGSLQFQDSYSDVPWQINRNLSFSTEVYEISQVAEFNFFKLEKGSRDRFFSPFIFAGVGVFYHNPKVSYNGQVIRLKPLGTEAQNSPNTSAPAKYLLFQACLPVGGGVKFALNRYWMIQVEVGYRLTTTDYLDDISTIYPDTNLILKYNVVDQAIAADLSNMSLANVEVTGRQRGDSSNKDKYAMVGIALTYTFKGISCPSRFGGR
ncbi:MAG: hypothetical protein IIA45_01190 [Bacteroidetes bacterium]|nr:hypothetical protein [Bacteroidota bacterium]